MNLLQCFRKITYLPAVRHFKRVARPSTTSRSSLFVGRRFPKTLAVSLGFGSLLLYDGYVNEFSYSGAIVRFVRSAKIALQIAADYAWHFRSWTEDTENYGIELKAVHQRSADRILHGCLANGGLFIKIGQGVSAINHILPTEYTETLAKLQNQCLPSDEDDVRRVFVQDFGSPPEEVFTSFDYRPIAAASLAQVFKAKLRTGEKVAVKVQYVDLQKRFSSDIGTIIFLQDIFELFFKNYNFGWIVRDLRKNLEMELDFINEGHNAERCSNDLKTFKFVHIPKVYWDHTKTRVLTAEWIDGFKVSDMSELHNLNVDLKDLDEKLFTVFSEQIFNTGFVHADPHPGNVYVRKSPQGKIEVVLLDHGLYEILPESVRLPLCEFWEATVLKDEDRMKTASNKLKIKNYKNFAEVLFQTPYELKRTVFKSKLTDADIAYMQEKARQNFRSIMETLREMPRNMLFVVRNLNTVRAISRGHGDPVDRPRLMARYAQRCLYKREYRIFGFIKWTCRRLRFEYCLIRDRLKLRLLKLYIDVLHKLGRSPKNSKYLVGRFEEAI